jgi:hypothetical protein
MFSSSLSHLSGAHAGYARFILEGRSAMHIQIVNFHLPGIGDEEIRAMSDQLAPAFAEVRA